MEEGNPIRLNSVFIPSYLIIDEILPRLPAKSLVRFTSVCKAWRSTIKSPPFIAAAMNSNKNLTRTTMMILDDRSSRFHDSQTLAQLAEFPIKFRGVTPFHSCNGLVLLYYNVYYRLWNPSIRRFKKLENIGCGVVDDGGGEDMRCLVHGLGFHEASKDHRVVRIVYTIDFETKAVFERGVKTAVYVYSLAADRWRFVDDADPGRLVAASDTFHGAGLYLNQAVHWLAGTGDRSWDGRWSLFESILLFDFEDECFREIGLPAFPSSSEYNCFGPLRELDGSLALLLLENNSSSGYNNGIWVMTEYGVAESWSRKFVITNNTLDPEMYMPELYTGGSRMLVRTPRKPTITQELEEDGDAYALMDISNESCCCRELLRFGRRWYHVYAVDVVESLVLLSEEGLDDHVEDPFLDHPYYDIVVTLPGR